MVMRPHHLIHIHNKLCPTQSTRQHQGPTFSGLQQQPTVIKKLQQI
ncbi:hypothetical protein MtrunA17_Chr2g0317771 [Medicago truncatula]|uniref:Uncharacterized protein n=1 Tax=Medicago truncatula TaxID=3880 RepID=A0A396JA16_MEDTR|nr:hypothetical protein MtrunA17_Chr2g0317771 [Medicago truncatula]